MKKRKYHHVFKFRKNDVKYKIPFYIQDQSSSWSAQPGVFIDDVHIGDIKYHYGNKITYTPENHKNDIRCVNQNAAAKLLIMEKMLECCEIDVDKFVKNIKLKSKLEKL